MLSIDKENRFIRYFKAPLLGMSSMTSYGVPNSMVHIPVIIAFLYIGSFICGAGSKFLLPVYFLVAMYIARDFVIIAYRKKFVPVIIWGIFIPMMIFKAEVSGFVVRNLAEHAGRVTLSVLAAFAFHIEVYTKYIFKWR